MTDSVPFGGEQHSSLDSSPTTMDWSWNAGLYRMGLQDGEQRHRRFGLADESAVGGAAAVR